MRDGLRKRGTVFSHLHQTLWWLDSKVLCQGGYGTIRCWSLFKAIQISHLQGKIILGNGLKVRLYRLNKHLNYLQVFIVLATLALASVGLHGSLNIRQEFDPIKMLPGGSYLKDFIDSHNKYFPEVLWNSNGKLVYLWTLTIHPRKCIVLQYMLWVHCDICRMVGMLSFTQMSLIPTLTWRNWKLSWMNWRNLYQQVSWDVIIPGHTYYISPFPNQ